MSGHLVLPGTAGNTVTTLDHASLDVVSDIDIRVLAALNDWTPVANAGLLNKYLTTGNQRSYRFIVNPAGTLGMYWTVDGIATITTASTAATGFTGSTAHWVRMTLDVDNGASGYDLKFWTADGSLLNPSVSDFTQLGATVVGGATTSIFSGTANVGIGFGYNTDNEVWPGNLYRAQIYDGIDGTLVLDADFTHLTANEVAAGSFVENTGKTVAINGAAWTYSPAAGLDPLLLLGVG